MGSREVVSKMEKNGLVPYSKQQKLQEWVKMIEARKRSGLPVEEWCAENQITPRQYYYRHRQVMKAIDLLGPQQKTEFAEIRPERLKASDCMITVRLGEAEVFIPEGMTSYTIESVLRVLREPC